MLSVQDVHTYYGDSYVLQGVSLEVKPGEVVAILGRNGVGKTTLVRSIVGLTPARRGRIAFRDADITRLPAHRIARMGIGLVPQGRRVFRSLTVRENLTVVARGEGPLEPRQGARALPEPAAPPALARRQAERRRAADARRARERWSPTRSSS